MNLRPKKSICFVTNELYPLGPGGIGRMLYNFAQYNSEQGQPADFHFLVPQQLLDSHSDASDRLAMAFDGVATVHVCPSIRDKPTPIGQLLAKSLDHPWTNEWLYAQSYAYYLGLLAAEQRLGFAFDVIEFPDFGGWAQAAIEAKRAGLAFQNTLISARIHSTQGMLYAVERYVNEPGHWAGIMFDAERHLLAYADLVVGHDPEIIAHTGRFYGLADRWEGRTRLEFPPVYLNMGKSGYQRADLVVPSVDVGDCRDFLFGSRLQPVKRPDLFIRAAILFLERHPAYQGMFRLVCSGWDRTFIDGLKSLVPEFMASRILFLENATSEERLNFIDNSIVVVPSDYESLCLFAFEAALAGRKVILNAVCPAFGNGFRWHDGRNCLLFDGSVQSLADVMERSLTWQPSSSVAAVPDEPYWLGDLSVPVVDAPVPHHSGPTAVLCFGAQAPSEFRRHFDGACRVEQELSDAGEEHQIFFQLPNGAFDQDGPEISLIRKKGWRLLLSSGVRECPQMFGQRIASLGYPSVLMFPFGYDPAPGFASSAVRVMRSEPGLAIVSGHIEIVDGNTGRSDYVRVYSGEAPSTALLSSRLIAPLCLIGVDVLRRVGFDPWAGLSWFEVFARRCVLQGEKMLILPALAGALDGLLRHKPSTGKRVAAGLLDQLGIAAGWQARLLSIDPVEVLSDANDRPLLYGEDRLRQVFRINPLGKPRAWEPVGWQDAGRGVLVHPLDGQITIAELACPYRRVACLSVTVRNLRHDNAGAQVAIALARSQADVQDVLRALNEGPIGDTIALSHWVDLEPGGSADLALSCYSVSRGQDKIILMSRPRPGCSEANAEIVFNNVEIQFNNLGIG